MRKIITALFLTCAVAVYAQMPVTLGTRFDKQDGVTYVGELAITARTTDGKTEEELTAMKSWRIQKITTNGVFYAGGSDQAFKYAWDDRASTNTATIVYK